MIFRQSFDQWLVQTSWKDSKTKVGTKMGSTAGNDQNTLCMILCKNLEYNARKCTIGLEIFKWLVMQEKHFGLPYMQENWRQQQ